MTDIKEVLAQREKTHGAFEIHATVTQELKAVVNQHMLDQGRELNASMQESIDMILHKIGRVVAGNPNHCDHWDDIAGYALLISAQLLEPAALAQPEPQQEAE